MTQDQPSRLDRIEANLEAMGTRMDQYFDQQRELNAALRTEQEIQKQSIRIQEQSSRIMEQSLRTQSQNIERLTDNMDRLIQVASQIEPLTNNLNRLIQVVNQLAELVRQHRSDNHGD